MQLVYGKNLLIFSVLDKLLDMKCFMMQGKLYKFFVKNSNLILEVFSGNSYDPCYTYTVERNVKIDFCACIDELNNIHIVTISRKYELIYIVFDGTSWKRQVLYSHNNELGIPNGPEIMVRDNYIYIILSFIKLGNERKWSLWSYIRKNGIWSQKVLDKASGLCYNQQSFNADSNGNIHLVYRCFDEHMRSVLKYNFLSKQKMEWDRTRVIFDNGVDKYKPYLFINKSDQIYIVWTELNCDFFLCCGMKDSKDEYFKVNITESADSMNIWDDREHIRLISYCENGNHFDLCCGKKGYMNIADKIPQIQGGILRGYQD